MKIFPVRNPSMIHQSMQAPGPSTVTPWAYQVVGADRVRPSSGVTDEVSKCRHMSAADKRLVNKVSMIVCPKHLSHLQALTLTAA